MLATALIFLSAALHAVVNILTKRGYDKYVMRLLIGVFSALLLIPAMLILPAPRGIAVHLLIASGVVHALYEWLLVRSYETAAFSAVYPIARGSGAVLAGLGSVLVLGASISAVEAIGIAAVIGGIITMGWSHRLGHGAGLGIAFALATGCCIGCYTLIDAAGVRTTPNPFTYVAWFFLAHACAVGLVAPTLRGFAIVRAAARQWRMGLLLGALSIGTYGAAMLAYRFGATARLAALRETSVLFGTLLAVLVLKEHMTIRRWLAAFSIVFGAILLSAA